jgi:hypothetical protein
MKRRHGLRAAVLVDEGLMQGHGMGSPAHDVPGMLHEAVQGFDGQ